MKKYKIILLALLICFPSMLYSLPAEDIEVINNKDYFPRVHELFKNAKQSIYVIMFSAYYYDKYSGSQSNQLLQDLADAKKRGLDVKVILDQEKPVLSGFFQKKEIMPEQHKRVTQFLKENNVPYILDSQETTTHSKLAIVDGIYTVIGSANWSYSALTKNNETNALIKSREAAKQYTDYFNNIKEGS